MATRIVVKETTDVGIWRTILKAYNYDNSGVENIQKPHRNSDILTQDGNLDH